MLETTASTPDSLIGQVVRHWAASAEKIFEEVASLGAGMLLHLALAKVLLNDEPADEAFLFKEWLLELGTKVAKSSGGFFDVSDRTSALGRLAI